MESFIQHRRAARPGRSTATSRTSRTTRPAAPDSSGGRCTTTAATIRRPTAPRATSPLDRQGYDLTPTDQIDPAGEPLLMFHNEDRRILLSRRSETAPFPRATSTATN